MEENKVLKRNQKNNVSSNMGASPLRLKRSGLGKYAYHKGYVIPEGPYFSKVDAIKPSTTSKGDPAIDVYYEVQDANVVFNVENEFLPKDTQIKSHYIKHRYSVDSEEYDKFVDSMCEELQVSEFDCEEAIGITEHVTVTYDKNEFGSYEKRFPMYREEYYNEKLHKTYEVEIDDETDCE